jgi:peptidoglycan/LPS O-acetylase OafA/YrhL
MDAKARLDALAGLRFVAAAVVALAHLPELSRDPALGRVAQRFLSEGVYGLTFFFTLSGFVLAYGYLDRLAKPTRATLQSYLVARIARIWPLHLLTLGLVLWFPMAAAPDGIGPFLANVFLVHSWVPSLEYIQSYNSVAWTLSLEWFFYLLCPLALVGIGRWKSATPTHLHLAALGVWLVVVAIVLPRSSQVGFWPLYVCNVCPLVRSGEFLVGVLLGAAFVRGRVRSGPLELARTRRLWTGLEIAAVALVVVLIFRSHRVPLLFRMNGYYIPAVALLVTVFARERGRVSRAMASRTIVYLSELSFAFYLLHAIVFTHLRAAYALWVGVYAGAGLLVATTLLAAAAAHHLVERPMRERIVRWTKPKANAKIPVADVAVFRRAA